MMKKNYNLILALLFTINLSGQLPILQWADHFTGGGNGDYGYQIVTDTQENVYVVGTITGGIYDMDPGPGTVTIGCTPAGVQNIFFGKYTANGALVWAYSLGSTGVDNGLSIDLDNAGNVYIAGNFKLSVDFDPSASSAVLTSTSTDFFVAKYTSNGNYINAIQVPIRSSGIKMTVDNNNDVIVSGNFSGSSNVDFDPGAGVFNMLPFTQDAFIAKYSSSLAFTWAGKISTGNANNCYIEKIQVDALNRIYIAGSFSGIVDLDPSAATGTISNVGGAPMAGFFAKYNSNGTFVYGKGFKAGSTSSYSYIYDMALDNSANIYVTGPLNQYTVDIDPAVSTYTLKGNGYDSFLIKYDSSGVFNWGFTMAGPGVSNEAGSGITVDIYGNPVVTGYFNAGADFDPGPSTATLLATNSNTNNPLAFAAKYSSGGNYIWAFSLQSTASSAFTSCHISSNNYLYVWGRLNTDITFNPTGPFTYIASSPPSENNNFLAKYDALCTSAPSQPGPISGLTFMCAGTNATTYSVNSIVGAASYTWSLPGGWSGTSTSNTISVTPGASGTISVTASNACGTSSSSTLSVTVNPIPVANAGSSQTITCLSNSVILNGSGVSTYTWSGPGIVSGGNSSSPIVNMVGTYSLTGSTSGCNSNTATVIVSSNTIAPTVTAASSATLICGPPFQGTATITASGASTYSWNTSATTNSISVSPGTTTTYTVIGTATNGCTNVATFTQNVSACTGIEQFAVESSDFAVYPNPTNGILIIKGAKGTGIEIYNLIGEEIHKTLLTEEKIEIDLSSQPSGIYFIKYGSKTKKLTRQ